MKRVYGSLFLMTALASLGWAALADGETEQNIVTIASDARPAVYQFKVIVDAQGDLMALKYTSLLAGTRVFPLSGVQSAGGVVIMKQENRNIVTLRGLDVRPHDGGRIRMRYLFNGITGNYDNFDFEIRRQNGQWTLVEDCDASEHHCEDGSGRRVFRRMFLEKKTVFGRLVGIGKVKTYAR
jgi:hypothetical protein